MKMTVEDMLQLGRVAEQAGSLAEARALYADVVEIDAHQPEANHRLGVLLMNAELAEKALSYLQMAFQIDPHNEQHWVSFFEGLTKTNRFEQAYLLLEASRKRALAPGNLRSMRDTLEIELQRLNPPPEKLKPLIDSMAGSDVSSLYALSARLLAEYPRSFKIHNMVGVCRVNSGDCEKAAACFRKALAINPCDAETLNNLGGTLKLSADWPAAMEHFNAAIRYDPYYRESYINAGHLLTDSRQYDAAVPYFEKLLQIDPANHRARVALGICLAYLKNYDEAREHLEIGLRHVPDSASGRFCLAAVWHSQGVFDAAEAELLLASEIDPQRKIFSIALQVIRNRNTRGSKARTHSRPNLVDTADNQVYLDHLPVKKELLHLLRCIESRSFDDPSVVDTRYGPGTCTVDFNLCDATDLAIQAMTEDLERIMTTAVASKIEIHASFANIAKAGSGSRPHSHCCSEDQHFGLRGDCYSLVYYLDVGDQDCEDPGTLRILEPGFDYLPKNGDVIIMHGTRRHFATYGGKTDRILVGINFYATGVDL